MRPPSSTPPPPPTSTFKNRNSNNNNLSKQASAEKNQQLVHKQNYESRVGLPGETVKITPFPTSSNPSHTDLKAVHTHVTTEILS